MAASWLSPREAEIVTEVKKGIAAGRLVKEVAFDLGLKPEALNTWLSSLRRRGVDIPRRKHSNNRTQEKVYI